MTTSPNIPEWLAEFARSQPTPTPPSTRPAESQQRLNQIFAAERPPATGEIGEIVIAWNRDRTMKRTFLIAGQMRSDVLFVYLGTNEMEQATEFDLVTDGEVTGTGYDLLFQGELYAYIEPHQLDVRTGKLSDDGGLQALKAALKTDGESLNQHQGMAGPPLVHSDDPRREFKQAELAELRPFGKLSDW